jgi:hypothetical protein
MRIKTTGRRSIAAAIVAELVALAVRVAGSVRSVRAGPAAQLGGVGPGRSGSGRSARPAAVADVDDGPDGRGTTKRSGAESDYGDDKVTSERSRSQQSR